MQRQSKTLKRTFAFTDSRTLHAALQGLESKRETLQQQIEEVRNSLSGRTSDGKRIFSAQARKKMAEGQRKRWAEAKKTRKSK